MAVAIALATGIPSPARAVPHANDPLNTYWGSVEPGGNGCSSCHTLKSSEAAPDTSHIVTASRTFPDMKSANGGVTPNNLGCTYCHNRTTSSGKMKDALTHFSGQRSQHPVGRRFTGASAYTDTQGEYLSSLASNTADEMDCLDCHDETLVAPDGRYMAHEDPPANNPHLLVKVTAAGQYDEFCRSCHGALASDNWKSRGKDIRVTSHPDGRDAANALAEADGTLLLTSDPGKDGTADALTNQCAGCHAPHSSGNSKLFVSAYTNGTDCTACHLAGDRRDSYYKHGHGKNTPAPVSTYEYGGVRIDLAMPCTDCHQQLDTSTTNLAGTRKKHAEKLPVDGNRDTYKKNFNLSKNVNSTDAGTPTGNPEWGVCIACHPMAAYRAHVGYEGTRRGCQDCHDEHAEGSGANIFMIPEKSKGRGYFTIPTVIPPAVEAVTYTQPRFEQDHVTAAAGPFDFYREDGKGVCDNTECHGTKWSATTPGPMKGLMGSGPADTKHSGGYFPAGSGCQSCHSHKDPQGGWGAGATCDECHNSDASPNLTGIARRHADPNESLTYHSRHVKSPLIADCAECHLHNGRTVKPNTGTHADGVVNFGGPRLTEALDYSASEYDTIDCTGANGCHDAGDNAWKKGLGAPPDACAACHAADAGKALSQGGYPAPAKSSAAAHTNHIENRDSVTGGCDDCHGKSAATGRHGMHQNGSVEVVATAKLTSYVKETKTCVTSCHRAATANVWRD